MKNTVLALTIGSALLNPVFANGTELSKDTLNQESLTITKDQQPKDKQNKNVHLRTGLMMSGAKAVSASVFALGNVLDKSGQCIKKENEPTATLGFGSLIVLVGINALMDYYNGSYQENMWDPQSKKDHVLAFLKSIAGTATGSAVATFMLLCFGREDYSAKDKFTKIVENAIAGAVISGVSNIAYQMGEGIHSYFKNLS